LPLLERCFGDFKSVEVAGAVGFRVLANL
jgi:hypothetical protein